MIIYRYILNLIGCLFLLNINVAYPVNNLPVEFFASNNTQEISLQTAYLRLTGVEQSALQNSIINIMQNNHIEQGTLEDILGTYRMSNDGNMTADNTEHLSTSPYQHLSHKESFSLARKMAITLKQDSVAVLIPNKSKTLAGISIHFTSQQPDINEVINILHAKLPGLYNQAFSLHLINNCGDYNHAKVAGIEWLGAKLNSDLVKEVFPLEKIILHYGKVYLVHQNGEKERL